MMLWKFNGFSYQKVPKECDSSSDIRQTMSQKKDELHFDINGRKLKFGLEEFAIITSLNCGEISDFERKKLLTSGIIDKLIKDEKTANRVEFKYTLILQAATKT